MASTPQLIETAVKRFQAEVPALAKLKLVFGLELRARGDIQLYRVELPGPKITQGPRRGRARSVEIDRAQFNELAEKGTTEELPQGIRDRPHQGHGRLQRAASWSPRWSSATSSGRG